MTDQGGKLDPFYLIQRVALDSRGFRAHQELVTRVYSGKEFIHTSKPDQLRDVHDTNKASYYLLTRPDQEDSLAGTFRIIEDTGTGLPVLKLYPNLSIEGIRNRLCESTRVVSARRDISGRSNPTRSILFEAVVQALAYVRAHNLYAVISLGSPSIFESINAVFCGCQRALAAPMDYENGIVVPSIIWADEFETCVRTGRPDIYDYYEMNTELQRRIIS